VGIKQPSTELIFEKVNQKNNRIVGKFKHEQPYSLDFQTGFIYEHKTYLIGLKLLFCFAWH
jgi:hypothetical protein